MTSVQMVPVACLLLGPKPTGAISNEYHKDLNSLMDRLHRLNFSLEKGDFFQAYAWSLELKYKCSQETEETKEKIQHLIEKIGFLSRNLQAMRHNWFCQEYALSYSNAHTILSYYPTHAEARNVVYMYEHPDAGNRSS